MSSPSYRGGSLRRRVAEGRARREAKARRVYTTINVTKRTIVAAAGVVVIAAAASAASVASATTGSNQTNEAGSSAAPTVDCPTVADQLPEIPAAAQAEVDRELGVLEAQIERANDRLVSTQGQGGPNFAQNAIVGPLADQRAAVLDRIAIAIGRQAERPAGLEQLAACGLNEDDGAGQGGDQDDNQDDNQGGDQGDNQDGDGNGDGDGDNDGNGDGNGDNDNSGVNTVGPLGENGDDNGLDLLGRDCTASDLPIHTGFQSEEAQCVQTQAGEVSALENNPSLLITEFPTSVQVNEPFSYTVGTRNLLRDRFQGAADGGYYAESSFLDENGIQRGHFHNACINLGNGEVPTPDTLVNPQFFLAVEDGGGGAGEDFVTVQVEDGLPEPGLYRCMAWAGEPSHRMPMMNFARQQIAVDVFRLEVTG